MKVKIFIVIGIVYVLASLTGCASEYERQAKAFEERPMGDNNPARYAEAYLLFQQMQLNDRAINESPRAPAQQQVIIQQPKKNCNNYSCPDYYK